MNKETKEVAEEEEEAVKREKPHPQLTSTASGEGLLHTSFRNRFSWSVWLHLHLNSDGAGRVLLDEDAGLAGRGLHRLSGPVKREQAGQHCSVEGAVKEQTHTCCKGRHHSGLKTKIQHFKCSYIHVTPHLKVLCD